MGLRGLLSLTLIFILILANMIQPFPRVESASSALASKKVMGEASASDTYMENVVFFDDFEDYPVGSFPSSGGWEIVWGGLGPEYQVVTDKYSFSGGKSLQLQGAHGLTAVVQRRFHTDAPVIGYEFTILIEDVGNPVHMDHPAFFNETAAEWGAYYAVVIFRHDDQTIRTQDGSILGVWTPGKWYKVRVVLNRTSNTYSVWINGSQVGENIPLPEDRQNTEKIEAIALVAGWHEAKVYYDDVKVFTLESIGDTLANAREELYNNYAKALNPMYWMNAGNELLLMFSKDFSKSFYSPLEILKNRVEEATMGDYSKAELFAKELVTLTSTVSDWSISYTLSWSYMQVNAVNGYHGHIYNASQAMKDIYSLIEKGDKTRAMRKINDLINYLKVARDQLVLHPAMGLVNKDKFVIGLFNSTIEFLLGELHALGGSETVISLNEASHKLYLHVYDNMGRHVGVNYETNQVEVDIPGSYYIDLGKEIRIMIPLNITSFRYIVDGKYASEPVENYSITITTIKDGSVTSNIKKNNTIKQGEKQEFSVSVSPDTGELKVVRGGVPHSGETLLDQLLRDNQIIIIIIVVATIIALLIWRR